MRNSTTKNIDNITNIKNSKGQAVNRQPLCFPAISPSLTSPNWSLGDVLCRVIRPEL